MEIKAQLNKPYTEEQRIDFIIKQNHRQGYEILETETALEAWGYTEEEIIEQQKIQKIEEINEKIKELNQMIIQELRLENTQNIECYNQVIKGLEETRDNL